MNNQNKSFALHMALLLLLFYTIIVGYILFGVVNIFLSDNFVSGIVFQTIGIMILIYLIVLNISNRGIIKTGFFVPIISFTIIYTIILDIINFLFSFTLHPKIFLMLHLILLFVYLTIVVPMVIMGKR